MKAEQLIELLKRQHPYPDDVFRPPTKKQWQQFHKALKDAGLPSMRFVGHACRIGYDACLHQIEKFTDID